MQIEICPDNTAALEQLGNVEVSLYDTISSVPERDWLRFVPEHNSLLKPDYLRLIEQTKQGDMQFIYALVMRDGRLIGVCYFQVVRFRGDNLLPYFPSVTATSFFDTIRCCGVSVCKCFVARLDLPLLVSGNLFVTGEQGIYFLPEITAHDQSYYLSYTIDVICRQRPYIKTSLLPALYEPSGDFDTAFVRSGYNRMDIEADMSMVLPDAWHNFEDYLGAISSKYRVRARKILQVSAELTTQEMGLTEIETQLDRLFYLYQIVADKADFNIAKFPKSYFLDQKRLSPDTYKVFGYYLNGVLVGFMSLFIQPHRAEVHYCGIDYSINKELNLYQRMLYDMVRYGIEHRLHKLHFGRTAPEVKSTIGAIPQPMYGYIRHRNTAVNYIISLFTSRLKPREYILRSPFK